MKSLFKNDKNNLYKPSDDGKRMDNFLKDIITNDKSVEAYGNKFKFFGYDGETFSAIINKREFSGSFNRDRDRTLYLCAKKNIEYIQQNCDDYCFRHNHKTYSCKREMIDAGCSLSFVLDQDLSLIEMSFSNDFMSSSDKLDIIAMNDKGEKCYLPRYCNNFTIFNQNFYTFDKDKNITGVKQQETFKISNGYEKTKEINGLEIEELTKEQKEEARKKIEFLDYLSKKAREEGVDIFYVTFKGDRAFGLVNDRLFFAKKNDEKYVTTEEKEIKRRGYISKNLTAFNGCVFVEYNLGVLVFDEKTNQLKSDLKGKNLLELSYFDLKKMRPLYDFYNGDFYENHNNRNEFEKKLKVFFDNNAVKNDNKNGKMKKEKDKKNVVKDSLKNKKCIIY